MGLGWSLEAIQLSEDAARILQNEARLTEVMDPLAGSYYVESLTTRSRTPPGRNSTGSSPWEGW